MVYTLGLHYFQAIPIGAQCFKTTLSILKKVYGYALLLYMQWKLPSEVWVHIIFFFIKISSFHYSNPFFSVFLWDGMGNYK